jgi:hypothetical protein
MLKALLAAHSIRHIAARLLPLPAAFGFGTLHLPQAGGLYPAHLDQFAHLDTVDLRPFAPRPAWGEPEQPMLVVDAVRLAVDPTTAQATSRASVKETVSNPEPFLARSSQNPSEGAWCSTGHVSHASRQVNGIIGSSGILVIMASPFSWRSCHVMVPTGNTFPRLFTN